MVHYNFSSQDYYLNSYTGQDADDNYFGRLQMKIRSHTGQDKINGNQCGRFTINISSGIEQGKNG